MRRNIRRNSENTAGSCVRVSIKHQTAGSPLGQHIAGCLFTSLPSHLLSLPASANRHINVPSSRLHPPPICLTTSHLCGRFFFLPRQSTCGIVGNKCASYDVCFGGPHPGWARHLWWRYRHVARTDLSLGRGGGNKTSLMSKQEAPSQRFGIVLLFIENLTSAKTHFSWKK